MDTELISLRIDFIIKHIDLAFSDLSNVEIDDFGENSLLARGVSFSLEQVCEHVSKLKKHLETDHAEIPWDKIYNMRILIAHMYTKVDTKKVYQIVKNDLPPLREQLLEIKVNL